jgi:enamine deaminase RidA (YjgF/YER057c/UK114 family)
MSGPSAEQLQGPLSLPASTGIQGENRLGAASVMDVLAVMRTPASQVDVVQMGNVRQADAFEYGSAFSRGACIREPDMTQIQISGTAAVDEQGRSVCSGDARAQALWTLDTVEALIGQQGAGLTDICQATVFLKRAQDYTAYQQALAERGLNEMPAVCVLADVCRDELLFEMDGMAAFAR